MHKPTLILAYNKTLSRQLYSELKEFFPRQQCLSIMKVHSFLDEIKTMYKDKNILLITHGAVVRTIKFYFEEMPEDGMLLNVSGQKNCEIKKYKL